MSKRYTFTRTVILSTITVMACDKETADVFNYSFNLSGPVPGEKQLKRIAQDHAPENAVVVAIADIDTTKTLLGMTEEMFLANAVKLDPKTRKPI